ncbi:hypothetical protein DKP78_23460, partial [Enterococcus faecium]
CKKKGWVVTKPFHPKIQSPHLFYVKQYPYVERILGITIPYTLDVSKNKNFYFLHVHAHLESSLGMKTILKYGEGHVQPETH